MSLEVKKKKINFYFNIWYMCMNNICLFFLFRFMKFVRVGEDIVIDVDILKVGKILVFCFVDIKFKSIGLLVV